MTERAAILVVEDDVPTRTFLADNLTADGYDLIVAGTLDDALGLLERHRVDLVLVDVALPDGSGLELLRKVREAGGPAARIDARLPLLVVSGRAGESDRVRSFERGADDFVAKPFAYGELRLRVAALLRRSRDRRADGRVRVGALDLDPASREVRIRGTRVVLSQKEYALLRQLAAEPTRVWTKAELLRDVWGFRALGATRTLDSHACRLRQKLSLRGDRFVVNVWGVGYRLVDGEVPEHAAAQTAAALDAPPLPGPGEPVAAADLAPGAAGESVPGASTVAGDADRARAPRGPRGRVAS